MFVECITDNFDKWVLEFAVENHSWLFEHQRSKTLAAPVRDWLVNKNGSATVVSRCGEEIKIEFAFSKKSDAEHFMARFING